MALAVTLSRANSGIDAPLVSVETHLSNGLPAFTIVGLPEAAVKESRDRVRSAIINSHFEFPARRITVNLAPADLPKEGSRFDLAIALGILAASNQLPAEQLRKYEFIGELALSGELRGVRGLLQSLIHAGESGRIVMVPCANKNEARIPLQCDTIIAGHLLEVCAHLNNRKLLAPEKKQRIAQGKKTAPDLADVKGQPQARRALEIAAAGGHNLLFIGPPGTGKTMLASRLTGLLPRLEESSAIEVASIHSLAGKEVTIDNWRQRPFRAPHHTASAVAMVGGGSQPRPGEISLAHCGVLFLDELPEYDRRVLEVLREPLESGSISISRVNQQVEFPARFQLVAAMNPCPCGFYGDRQRNCRCSPAQIQRYNNKLSGPLLDRIDLHVYVNRPPTRQLTETSEEECSDKIKQRVIEAQEKQFRRNHCLNAESSGAMLSGPAHISAELLEWLASAIERLAMSARTFYRVIRIARTIADLAGSEKIEKTHLQEALSYRQQNKS